jgi:hypothetical protein
MYVSLNADYLSQRWPQIESSIEKVFLGVNCEKVRVENKK